jgi:uroporphyrinogen-III synthase
MSLPLILLRPQPGNDASAARARAIGLDPVQLPLFEIGRVEAGPAPEGPFDAILLSSANGARFGATVLRALAHLPAYAVGEATAQAARGAGVEIVKIGGGDASSTATMMVAEGHDRVLHLCGADVRPFDPQGLTVTRHVVYQVVERAEETLRPELDRLISAVVAIHSPRAGRRLATLVAPELRSRFHIAAISTAAADACGSGWASASISAAPDDTALLHCVETLCIRAG